MAKKEDIEKYIKILQGKNSANPLELKQSFLPDTLFKYRPINKNTLDCLERGSIWVSSAESQNDPFDSSLFYNDNEFIDTFFRRATFKTDFFKNYGVEISDTEIKQIHLNSNPNQKFIELCKLKNINRDYDILSSMKVRKSETKKFIKKIKNEIKLSSFSERNDSILMWSHYSDKHKGICIEYDFNNEDYILNFLEPIYYTNQIISLSKAYGNSRYTGLIKVAAISKALDWQYEKEWRIVFPEPKPNSSGHFKVPKPKAIYLGTNHKENTPENTSYCNKIESLCKELNIPIFYMRLHNKEYKIVK